MNKQTNKDWKKDFWKGAGDVVIGESPPGYNQYLDEIDDDGRNYIEDFIESLLKTQEEQIRKEHEEELNDQAIRASDNFANQIEDIRKEERERIKEDILEKIKPNGFKNESKDGVTTGYMLYNYRCKEGEIHPIINLLNKL